MEQGWITIHRKLKDKGYYKDSHYVHLWLHLLLSANHSPNEFLWNGKIIKVQRGQLITGRKSLGVETGINEHKVDRILKVLESEQQIEQQKTTKYRLITILNYNKHQTSEQQVEKRVSNKRATSEQQVSTNNNDNKENNDKKITKSNSESGQFGNENINILVKYLEESIKGSLDGTQQENRRYCYLLINRFKKDYPTRNPIQLVEFLVSRGLEDNFHAKNITNFKYLYYNAMKIIQSVKADLNKNTVAKIS